MMNEAGFELESLEQWKAAQEAEIEDIPEPHLPENLPVGAVPIPVPEGSRQLAARLVEGLGDGETIEVMRRRLLAVLAVRDYLSFQGYIPDLEASDCWNPILRRLHPCGDLWVSQIGRVECCPFGLGQVEYAVPVDGEFGRVAYVGVELDGEERWAWLLGFVSADGEEGVVTRVRRQELLSMDEWGEQLRRLWLLWQILAERDEPWDVALRSDVCKILERIYETSKPFARAREAKMQLESLLAEAPASTPASGAVRSSESFLSESEEILPENTLNMLRAIFSELGQRLSEG